MSEPLGLKDSPLLAVDKYGLLLDPKYPCDKGPGLCRRRFLGTDYFACVFGPGYCEYRLTPPPE